MDDIRIRRNVEALVSHESSRYRAAAHHARRVYPGPAGELISRELTAYAEFGYRFRTDSLISRLAVAVLAAAAAEHADLPSGREQEWGRAVQPQARAG